MIDKVRRILGLSSRKTGNKLVISVEKLERRVALLEDGRLEEYSVERNSSRNIVGSVYKGKVKNIEMGLKAMFVDIGFEKNAFLHFWDAIPAALDSGIEEIDRRGKSRPKKRITAKDIPNIYPVGSDVIVQVTKGPIGTKGPRVTTNLSFAGRYLVLMPYSDRSGISRKIEDPKERDATPQDFAAARDSGRHWRDHSHRWRRTACALFRARPEFSARTMGAQSNSRFRKIRRRCALFEEPDLVERTVRDFLTEEIDEVVVRRSRGDRSHERNGRQDFAARAQSHSLLRRRHTDF